MRISSNRDMDLLIQNTFLSIWRSLRDMRGRRGRIRGVVKVILKEEIDEEIN